MMPALQAELQRGGAAFQDLAADWQRLWLAQPRREVFTSPAWCLAAWQADGEKTPMGIVVVRCAGDVVGLLPLALQPASFLSGVNADYNDMLVCQRDGDDAAAQIVAAALRVVLREIGGCVLDNLPEWSTLCRVLERLPPQLRRAIVVEPGQPCPALRLTADRDALLAAMLGKQSLKRHEKKLMRHGVLRLWHAEQREQILERLEDFFAQHVARRALAGGHSLFLQPRARDFYRRLLQQFEPQAELRFAVLEVDGRAVAYHFGFEVDGRFTWYKPSFDVDYWDCGVGEVLLKRLLEYVRDRPLTEFDFTRGDESFKDRFSNHRGLNVRWMLRAGPLAARAEALRGRIRSALRQHPVVNDIRAWAAAAMARCRPAPGSRPGRLPRSSGAAQTTGLPRLLRAREELLILSAERTDLLRPHDSAAGFSVTPCSLRQVALLSVEPGAPIDLEDLRQMREALRPGDDMYMGRAAGAVQGIAWIGARSAFSPMSSAFAEQAVELEADSAVIQFVGNAWPPPEGQRLRAMLVAMATQATQKTLWIACPAGARPVLRELCEAGFVPRRRLASVAWFGRSWSVSSAEIVPTATVPQAG